MHGEEQGGRMKKATLVFSILCTILSIAYLVKAFQFPMGAMNKPGPGTFPIFAGSLLFIGSIGSLMQTLVKAPGGEVEWPKGRELWRVFALAAAALVYAFGVEYLGHIIGAMIVTLTCLQAMGIRSWVEKIVIAFLLAIGSYYLFGTLLSSPLPKGLLEGVL
jgi:putative tricarboxylic transport membrane protein